MASHHHNQQGNFGEEKAKSSNLSSMTDGGENNTKRCRGRPLGWRKEHIKRERTTANTLITSRCCTNTAMDFLHNNVIHLLNDEHRKLLSETPFFHLFGFPRGTVTSYALLQQILLLWDPIENCFKLDNQKLEFTPEEISFMMCLPFDGFEVDYTRQQLNDSSLRLRYFPPATPIKREALEKTILSAIEEGSNASDVVSLIVMYLFTTILFPQTSGYVPVNMFHHVDDLNSLKEYAWGKACYYMLKDYIPACAAWCQAQTIDPSDDNTNPDATSSIFGGCAVALIVWFLEHTRPRKMVRGSGFIPRYLNWHLDTPFTRVRAQDMFAQINLTDVIKPAIKRKPTEKLMRDIGFHAWKYVEIITKEDEISGLDNEVLCEFLIQMAPVYWKLGFDVCSYLMDRVSKIRLDGLDYSPIYTKITPSLEAKYCEATSQAEKQFGVHRSQCGDKKPKSNAHSPKTPKTAHAYEPANTDVTPGHGKNAPKRDKPLRQDANIGKIGALKLDIDDDDDDTPIQILLDRQRKIGRQNNISARGKRGLVRQDANKTQQVVCDTTDDDFIEFGARRVAPSKKNKVTVKAKAKRRQPLKCKAPQDELYLEKESYSVFINKISESARPDQVVFDFKTEGWCYALSIFYEPFPDDPPSVPYFDADKNYPGRGVVSNTVSKLIDSWLLKVGNSNLSNTENTEKAYDDGDGLWCSVTDMKEFVRGQAIGVEIVEIIISLVRRFTPVESPWFFINPYLLNIIHKKSYSDILRGHPHFFFGQFDSASWLFLPSIGGFHWILIAADLKNIKIDLYNSLQHETDIVYQEMHKLKIKWLRSFLYWRTENPLWNNAPANWIRNIPKQANEVDCGLYMVRYIYNIIIGQEMGFDKEDVRNDRSILAYWMFVDVANKFALTN